MELKSRAPLDFPVPLLLEIVFNHAEDALGTEGVLVLANIALQLLYGTSYGSMLPVAKT